MKIYEFLIGVSGITAAAIFIAKFLIKWLGDASLEKYKNELFKESLTHQNNLDKSLEIYKTKFNILHLDQVEIIKKLYSMLIKAERPLEHLMRPLKMSGDKPEKEIADEVIQQANDFFNFFDENEIIFNVETCELINLIREKYIKVWNTYSSKIFMGENISGELQVQLYGEMKKAYDEILKVEFQNLKKELIQDFRKKLGVIEEKN